MEEWTVQKTKYSTSLDCGVIQLASSVSPPPSVFSTLIGQGLTMFCSDWLDVDQNIATSALLCQNKLKAPSAPKTGFETKYLLLGYFLHFGDSLWHGMDVLEAPSCHKFLGSNLTPIGEDWAPPPPVGGKQTGQNIMKVIIAEPTMDPVLILSWTGQQRMDHRAVITITIIV